MELTKTRKKRVSGIAQETVTREMQINFWKHNIHPILGYHYPSTGAGAPAETTIQKVPEKLQSWKSLHI